MNVATRAIPNRRLNTMILLFATVTVFAVAFIPGKHYDVTSATVQQARGLIDSVAVFVDVRNEEAFKKRHIPDALLIPVAVLRTAIPNSLADAKAKPVVVYCGVVASIGPEGTFLLNQAGYAKAVNLKSGIAGRARAGLPVQGK